MKKTYVKAAVTVCKVETCSLMAGSEHVEGSSSQLTDDNDVVWDNNDNDSNN